MVSSTYLLIDEGCCFKIRILAESQPSAADLRLQYEQHPDCLYGPASIATPFKISPLATDWSIEQNDESSKTTVLHFVADIEWDLGLAIHLKFQ